MATAIATLAGCGGGGGGGGGGTPAVTSSVISGVAVGSAPAAASSTLASASVEVVVRDINDVEVDRQTVLTNAAGGYSIVVNDPTFKLTRGGYIVTTIRQPGFADFSSRTDFTSMPERVDVPRAELQSTVTAVVASGGSLTASASGHAFSFGLIRQGDGSVKALSGNEFQAAKAAGASTELEINIPAASLPDTDTLVAQMRSFDAADADDARRFPGDYKDTNGNRIVSLGFDYISISDGDTGENIGDVAAAARASSGGPHKAAIDWSNPTVVTRYLPQGSVNNLLQDACNDATITADIPIADPTSNCSALRAAYDDVATRVNLLGDEARNGFNVPIYTYVPSLGVWELLGIGTLVKDYNGNASSMLTYADVSDLNTDGVINSADFRAYAASTQVYVRIYVTNETFKRQYWNLDYPLLTALPRNFCVSGQLRNDAGAGIAGQWLSLSDNDTTQTFNYASTSTDASGNFRLSTILMEGAADATTDRTATLSYYNSYESAYDTATVTLTEAPGCTTHNPVITRPLIATVQGRVFAKNGQPKASEWVWGSSSDGRYFSTSTGTDGRFRMEVRQNTEYALYFSNSALASTTFNANGTASGKEVTDTTTQVNLGDFAMLNRAPTAYGYPNTTSARLKGSATTAGIPLYFYGYDYDSDFPLIWSVLDGATCNEDGTFTGGTAVLTHASPGQTSMSANDYVRRPTVQLAVGDHDLVIGVTDSLGKQGCGAMSRISVAAAVANRAPIASYLITDRSSYARSAVITLSASAYDLDGDVITGVVTTSPAVTVNCGESGANTGRIASCTMTAPNADTELAITWTVSDGALSSTRTHRVLVGTPPSSVSVTVQ